MKIAKSNPFVGSCSLSRDIATKLCRPPRTMRKISKTAHLGSQEQNTSEHRWYPRSEECRENTHAYKTDLNTRTPHREATVNRRNVAAPRNHATCIPKTCTSVQKKRSRGSLWFEKRRAKVPSGARSTPRWTRRKDPRLWA